MKIIEQTLAVSFAYPVVFTRDALDPANPALRDVFARAGEGPHRVVVVLDAQLLWFWPDITDRLGAYAAAHPEIFAALDDPFVLPGGEECKTELGWLPELLERFACDQICRHSFVLAIGGGSLLDAAGHAASLAHRGVRLVRMPTTVLAQNDAGIGVKNAVNFRGRKNFVGSFTPPFAVLNDFGFLGSLDRRDARAGMAEAIKVALIRDADFFDWLYAERGSLARFEQASVEEMIERCADLHLRHIREGGDPFETGSARPLDFGHWSAHKLEELSGWELRHGEAVALGIAIDATYAHRSGRIGEADLSRILQLLGDLGFALSHPALEALDIDRALEDFRAHLGGSLCLCFPEGIGQGVEVGEIDRALMGSCVEEFAPRG
jgi:3-dehydroquinate synthase